MEDPGWLFRKKIAGEYGVKPPGKSMAGVNYPTVFAP